MASCRWPRTYTQERVHIHNQVLRLQVKTHCCSAGVFPSELPYYYSFGLELDRHIRNYGGGELSVMIARQLVKKWAERGLKPDLLREITLGLTNVVLVEERAETRIPKPE